MATSASLVASQNHVETPFIILRVGDYKLGHCDKAYRDKMHSVFNVTYPNYMESLNIVKVNGAVNVYTLNMVYAITQNDDPNRLEKIFSSISKSRIVYLTYGDWSSPEYVYKEEQAIVTKLTTRIDVANSKINYTLNCTSAAVSLRSTSIPFPAKRAKPSNEIIALLKNKDFGLLDIFKGMKNFDASNFIDTSDQEVQLEARNLGILEYISYLVSCMVYTGDSVDSRIKSSCYFWSVYDDTSDKYGGTYFKVVRVAANTSTLVSFNTYEVDVGFPSPACVTQFSVNNDDSWAILYDYASKIHMPEYTYRIDDDGNLVNVASGSVTNSKITYETNEATRNWWSKMTQFPITATLTMKGLLRPAMLMSYVKVNVYFYGHKHVSSGLYFITKQEDSISTSGYRTTLTLTRVGGDEYYT